MQIAGIDIGRIAGVELYQGKAKVILEIDGKIPLYADATIEKVSISLLGDYKLSVDPGHEIAGESRTGGDPARQVAIERRRDHGGGAAR